jgi:hypothetical protein
LPARWAEAIRFAWPQLGMGDAWFYSHGLISSAMGRLDRVGLRPTNASLGPRCRLLTRTR